LARDSAGNLPADPRRSCDFRSPITGVDYDVDLWFDQVFKQTWSRQAHEHERVDF
jgi:hypothetical protein